MKIIPKISEKLFTDTQDIRKLLDEAKSFEANEQYKEACYSYACAIDQINQERNRIEADLHSIFNNMQDVYYRTDKEGYVTTLSPSGAELLGCQSTSELIGRNLIELYLYPEKRQVFLEELSAKGKVSDYEVELKKADGSIITVSTNSQYYRDEYGNIAGIEGICRDITDRKKAEKALQTREAELRAIIENSATGITVSDLNGKILETNPAHQKILGYDPGELKTMMFSDFTHPDDIGKHQASYKSLIAGEIDHFNMRKRFIHKNGRVVWTRVNVSLVRDNNNPLFVIGMVEDITARKLAEDDKEKLITELQQALYEIKILRGIIPICSHCKQVRDDKGFWSRVENYIEQHTEALFSHGVCPDCLKEHYPHIYYKKNPPRNE
jgi:PAS domain S-box-containing protein